MVYIAYYFIPWSDHIDKGMIVMEVPGISKLLDVVVVMQWLCDPRFIVFVWCTV
jgi:hypothetical protein